MNVEGLVVIVGLLFGGGVIGVLGKSLIERRKTMAEAKRETAETERIDAEREISVANTALKIVEEQRIEYTAFKVEAKAEFADLKRENRDAADRLTRMRESLDKMIDENGGLKREVQQLTIDNVQLTHRIEGLQEELRLTYSRRLPESPVKVINQIPGGKV